MPTEHNFDKIVKEYSKFKDRLMYIVGQEGVKFSKDNFRKQGFQDNPFKPWRPRKPRAKRNKGRAILVDTARLKRSIRVTRVRRNKVWIGSNVPYASIHNEGGRITTKAFVKRHTRRTRSGRTTVSAHSRNMNVRIPRRRFIGASVELDRRIKRKIRQKLIKIFNAK